MSNVTSLNGGPSGVREVNEHLIEVLEGILERARAGEAVGGAIILLHYDSASSWMLAGRVGGYSMLGACSAVKHALLELEFSD